MKIKQRMNSYPILSEISDDYINSSFTTDIAWYDIEKTKINELIKENTLKIEKTCIIKEKNIRKNIEI